MKVKNVKDYSIWMLFMMVRLHDWLIKLLKAIKKMCFEFTKILWFCVCVEIL